MYNSTQIMVLRAGDIPTRESILNLRGTKALRVMLPNLEKETEVTTWSNLVRVVIDWLKEDLLNIVKDIGIEKLNEKYKETLNEKLRITGIKLNSNCPVGIYKDNEIEQYMNSTVYLNNKNHKLELFKYEGHSYNVCAVYTGEIIFILSTLISIIDDYNCKISMQKELEFIPKVYTLQIIYINRKDIPQLEADNFNLDDIMTKDTNKIKNAIVIAYNSCKTTEAQLINICNMLDIDIDFLDKF